MSTESPAALAGQDQVATLPTVSPIAQPVVAGNDDPLAAFSDERADEMPVATAPRPWRPPVVRLKVESRVLVGGLLILGVALSTVAVTRRYTSAAPPPPPSGGLAVDTKPAGIKVVIDGQERGLTPLNLRLAAGTHEMALLNDSERHVVPLNVVAGRDVSQYFEFAAPAPVRDTGAVSLTSDETGRVTIDGKARGTTPLVVSDLPVGDHSVTVTSESGKAERTVRIEPGATASVAFSFAKASGPAAGWLTVSSPFDVQVFEAGVMVALSGAKVMLPAGRHELQLVNTTLGYEESRRLEISAGKAAAVAIEAPKTTISVNARPWAEVFVDGASVGQTPLSNVSVAIGPHAVVFRHPQLGEQRQTLMATTKGPNRISIDMTKR